MNQGSGKRRRVGGRHGVTKKLPGSASLRQDSESENNLSITPQKDLEHRRLVTDHRRAIPLYAMMILP
jgi:hypothetical protein